MCQQILQFCSGSARPLLFAGGLMTFLLSIAIGYTGFSTYRFYLDIGPPDTAKLSLTYYLQLGAALYLGIVTCLSCYSAHYDQKYFVRVLFVVTTVNFFLALGALFIAPTGPEFSEPFQKTLKQAMEKYDFSYHNSTSNADSTNIVGTAVNGTVNNPAALDTKKEQQATPNNQSGSPDATKTQVQAGEMSNATATRTWDLVQAHGCCGINNATDWGEPHKIPKSCCKNATVETNVTFCGRADADHQQGCMVLIGSASLNLLIVLGLIALVNFYLATISGISAYKTYSYSEASQNAYT